MILDVLSRADRYVQCHPGFEAGFRFLQRIFADPGAVQPGKHVLVKGKLWVVIEAADGRTPAAAPLEFHRRHIDIQLVLEGIELVGWSPLTDGVAATVAFDAERDIGFLPDRPRNWLQLVPGEFAVFFPTDAHAPLAGTGRVLKAIAKVAVHW